MPVQEHEFRKGRLMNSLFFSAAGFPYRGEASKSAIHSARLTATDHQDHADFLEVDVDQAHGADYHVTRLPGERETQ